MKKPLMWIVLAAGFAAPAQATGGFVCRTAGGNPIEVAIGFGHTPGAPLILTRLIENGQRVPVTAPQWWLDNEELRLLLTDPDSTERRLVLRARRNGQVYDGSVWRGGKRRWVRCQEG